MAYKLNTSTGAYLDIEKAIVYYKGIKSQLAENFLIELKATRKYIQKHPKKIQVRYANIRVAFLKRFPFGVHFRFENETVTIVSVFHTSQDDKKWKERM
ncbi:MAG: hypothetical protein COA33_012950 [Fluviicola sp.]|nr:hypothetical protein [Fluviicola sp.]